ncbi:hypothetical protein J6590_103390 [Homalodisca vitripennis]|nr:hypothetical protein J6590_103390 [Homalodisca vitripennis]
MPVLCVVTRCYNHHSNTLGSTRIDSATFGPSHFPLHTTPPSTKTPVLIDVVLVRHYYFAVRSSVEIRGLFQHSLELLSTSSWKVNKDK